MENNSAISLPRDKCMKCGEEFDILLSFHAGFVNNNGNCFHEFCQSCFRIENSELAFSITHKFTCPCCQTYLYEDMQSVDEAIIIGEALMMRNHLSPHLFRPINTAIADENLTYIDEMNKEIIVKLEDALRLNPTSVYCLYLLMLSCYEGHLFVVSRGPS